VRECERRLEIRQHLLLGAHGIRTVVAGAGIHRRFLVQGGGRHLIHNGGQMFDLLRERADAVKAPLVGAKSYLFAGMAVARLGYIVLDTPFSWSS